MSEDIDKRDHEQKKWSFLTGIGYIDVPTDASIEERIKALANNQFDIRDRIDTLRTHILDLDRRLRNSEKKKGKWWNK